MAKFMLLTFSRRGLGGPRLSWVGAVKPIARDENSLGETLDV